jgi:hypothetical protein
MARFENPFNFTGGPFIENPNPEINIPTTSTKPETDADSPSAVQAQADAAAKQRQEQADAAQAARDSAQRYADEQIRAAQETNRQNNAIATMRGVLTQLNLSGLFNTVVDFIKKGYDADAIQILIRTTPEYKQRFPAMDALAAKGRTISESEYIGYEQAASGLERRYGLPQGMLMNSVTDLLTNEVSAVELNDRVLLASAASIQAPQDVKDQFKNYYNIDQGGLTAYFLDPDKATPLLEKQYATSVIGAEAQRQGLMIDVYGAENLQNLGITQEQARQGFGEVASATGLTSGAGDIVTQQELIGGTFNTDANAKKAVQRAVGGRLGRFQGGGEFLQNQQGAVGLGSAATR